MIVFNKKYSFKFFNEDEPPENIGLEKSTIGTVVFGIEKKKTYRKSPAVKKRQKINGSTMKRN